MAVESLYPKHQCGLAHFPTSLSPTVNTNFFLSAPLKNERLILAQFFCIHSLG